MLIRKRESINNKSFFLYFSLDLFVILPHRLDIYTQRDGAAADRKKDKWRLVGTTPTAIAVLPNQKKNSETSLTFSLRAGGKMSTSRFVKGHTRLTISLHSSSLPGVIWCWHLHKHQSTQQQHQLDHERNKFFLSDFSFFFSFSLFTPRRLRSSAGKNVVTVDISSSTGRVVSESEMTRVYQKGNPRNREEEDSCHLHFSLSRFPWNRYVI